MNSTRFSWNVSFLYEILPLPFKKNPKSHAFKPQYFNLEILAGLQLRCPAVTPPELRPLSCASEGQAEHCRSRGLIPGEAAGLGRLWCQNCCSHETGIASHSWRTVRHWYLVSSSTASPCTCELLGWWPPTTWGASASLSRLLQATHTHRDLKSTRRPPWSYDLLFLPKESYGTATKSQQLDIKPLTQFQQRQNKSFCHTEHASLQDPPQTATLWTSRKGGEESSLILSSK